MTARQNQVITVYELTVNIALHHWYANHQ